MVGAAMASIVQAAGPVAVRGIGAISGDTIVIEFEGESREIMIDGVDAPEAGQPYGPESKAFASALVAGKDLTIEIVAQTTSGELIGRVEVDGLDVAHEILAAGAAWHDTADNEDEQLLLTFMKARSGRQGLWANPSPVSPRIWRDNNKRPPTPTPRPKSLARLADDMRLRKAEQDKAGSASDEATSVADTGSDYLVLDANEVSLAVVTCLTQRGDMTEGAQPYVDRATHHGSEVHYEISVNVPDPEMKTGRKIIRYKWVGKAENGKVRLTCAELVAK